MVSENEKVKILWHMKVQTVNTTEHSRPDTVVHQKKSTCRHCNIIDVSCPFDTHVHDDNNNDYDYDYYYYNTAAAAATTNYYYY